MHKSLLASRRVGAQKIYASGCAVHLPLVALNSSTFKLREAFQLKNLETASPPHYTGRRKEIPRVTVLGSQITRDFCTCCCLQLLFRLLWAGKGKALGCLRSWWAKEARCSTSCKSSEPMAGILGHRVQLENFPSLSPKPPPPPPPAAF